MIRPFLDQDSRRRLMELIRINHGLLVALGVSHPSLERVKALCDQLHIGETKLTGAGGGGCAITLLDEDMLTDVRFAELKKKFDTEGFETFKTTLGGKGVGLLTPTDAELIGILTTEDFKAFKNRDQIEDSIGCSSVDAWRYW
ncbi:unnamed protein product [Ambrosiozyma monospora]|nr:unnamed protein product [Ambrosiozyma monospora]